MRHRKAGKKLNRNTAQRKALFKNLIQSLILHEEIKTTEAKAKAIKGLMAKLISKAKKGSLHKRRQIMAFLPDKRAVKKLFDDLGPRFKQRNGGFTRFVRLGNRKGDDAMIVRLELTEKKEKEAKEEKTKKKDKKK
ncbi:50S ribosomal protein L17 [Candidatus Beckwithbacteria bacterium CG10_big_fil_rev_8_21_14_0_10_34_10]|uniref:Large ribosomal subunit protein bL17 n=1 Tax=Candidatus Beckwithbacteria bacterium CG10_big_fil_rev_8_21_14_0_10_34_10 TaxID=1974495 RepID=A0A2H0W843_9BACT|nr:MAG: 50S ribosomal protein L17 [Candidatus Beckwithbacteria bacterium CG10_big_fil_rev_8_21_14_0_10_34_10]